MSGVGVKVFAPATVANLAVGFDVLGLAVAGRGDVVRAVRSGAPGVRLVEVTGDGGRLPREPDRNTACVAARETMRAAGLEIGVDLYLEKGLPLGSGLGSSAASAAAAALATNALLGSPLRRGELVGPCVEAEAVVSGRHADNVAPALLGGLILVRALEPMDLVRLPMPPELTVAVVTPALELNTKAARAALPAQVPLAEMVRGSANIAAFTAACYSQDLTLMARCFEPDPITEARAALIPGCREALAAAERAGALGSGISGSGPSLFALCRSKESAGRVAAAMQAAFQELGHEAETLVSPAECPGARIL
ncbi:MAG: homoserine kinase [Deltaproteobacteria bacterium]|nr:homoserine kinase [Deltaproteobacteria bacterium]